MKKQLIAAATSAILAQGCAGMAAPVDMGAGGGDAIALLAIVGIGALMIASAADAPAAPPPDPEEVFAAWVRVSDHVASVIVKQKTCADVAAALQEVDKSFGPEIRAYTASFDDLDREKKLRMAFEQLASSKVMLPSLLILYDCGEQGGVKAASQKLYLGSEGQQPATKGGS